MGGKLTSLAQIEPVCTMYICTYAYKSKKKSSVAGSNHKNANQRSSALLTTPSGHIQQREIGKVIRNPLGLKSEVRIQEKYKKIKMSKTGDFLKNPR